MISITTERRRAWLQAISREGLTEEKEKLANVYICLWQTFCSRYINFSTEAFPALLSGSITGLNYFLFWVTSYVLRYILSSTLHLY